nr:immunoglobulin heavy chain junction region [Mus musculus]
CARHESYWGYFDVW